MLLTAIPQVEGNRKLQCVQKVAELSLSLSFSLVGRVDNQRSRPLPNCIPPCLFLTDCLSIARSLGTMRLESLFFFLFPTTLCLYHLCGQCLFKKALPIFQREQRDTDEHRFAWQARFGKDPGRGRFPDRSRSGRLNFQHRR